MALLHRCYSNGCFGSLSCCQGESEGPVIETSFCGCYMQPMYIFHCRDSRHKQYNSLRERGDSGMYSCCFIDSFCSHSQKEAWKSPDCRCSYNTYRNHHNGICSQRSYTLYSVFVEKAASFSEAEITFSMLAAGASLFVVLALSEAAINGELAELVKLPFTDRNFLSAILYQGIGCSILAFFLSNAAIARIGVNRTSSFIGVATVVSIIAGALILDEPFTLQQAIGAAVIIAGVYIANSRKPS